MASDFIEPCHAIRVPKAPSGPEWIHEIGRNGYRLQVRKDGESVQLFTNGGRDYSARFPLIRAAAQSLDVRTCSIDGEVVVEGENRIPRFGDLHRWKKNDRPIMYAFDLMELNEKDRASEISTCSRHSYFCLSAFTSLHLHVRLSTLTDC